MTPRYAFLMRSLSLCLLAWLVAQPSVAQLTTPVVSSYASVSERVGLTDIKITYGRPAVNGRQIWGGVVPYGLSAPFPNFGSGNPFPWRAGANENTTISFSDNVLIEGKPLAAGMYSLHMIPTETNWTVIFSRNATSWGSFFYDQREDALRVQVTPQAAPFEERLSYRFTGHDGNGKVVVALNWAELQVPIRVEIDNLHETVIAHMRKELRNTAGFTWQGWAQAAGYGLQNNTHHEQALAWADQALQRNRSFQTLNLKAGLLAQTGDAAGAEALKTEAVAFANEAELNAYGYQLMGQNRTEEAFNIFKLNVERHPASWNVHDSLAEAYLAKGDKKNARKLYQKALDMLPQADQVNRARVQGILSGM